MATWLDPESPGQATGSLQGIFSIGLFELGRHSLNVAGTFWLKSFALDHLPWLCWQAPLLCSHHVVSISPSAQPFFADVGIQLLWLSKADSVSVGVLQTCRCYDVSLSGVTRSSVELTEKQNHTFLSFGFCWEERPRHFTVPLSANSMCLHRHACSCTVESKVTYLFSCKDPSGKPSFLGKRWWIN